MAVGDATQGDRAKGKCRHHHRVRQRSGGAIDAEFKLRLGQDHDDRPHADADQSGDQKRQRQPGKGVSAVWRVPISVTERRGGGLIHGPKLRRSEADGNWRRRAGHCLRRTAGDIPQFAAAARRARHNPS